MLLSLLLIGSWANLLKIAGKWRFELFYFDFAIGLGLTALIGAFTFGNLGFDGFNFTDDLMNAGKHQWLDAFIAAVLFNLANMLLTASVSVAGMAVAFPVCFSFSFIVAALMGWLAHPAGSGSAVMLGVMLLLLAVFMAGMAYTRTNWTRWEALHRAGKLAKNALPRSAVKGMILAAAGGLLMGTYGPLLLKAQDPDVGMGPYALAFMFAAGVGFSTFVFNLFFMNLPVQGEPLEIMNYFEAPHGRHAYGLLAGILWGVGEIALFAATTPKGDTHPDITWGPLMIDAAPLLAALCGLLIWREFKDGDGRAKSFAVLMLLLFAAGAAVMAIAPTMVAK